MKLSLAGAATSIIFVATKDVFCRDKHMFVATKVCLSGQNFCREKAMFAATNICREKSFVTTKIFCHNKTLVATSIRFSRQTRVCRVCRDKYISWISPLSLSLLDLPSFFSTISLSFFLTMDARARVAFHIHSPSPQI